MSLQIEKYRKINSIVLPNGRKIDIEEIKLDLEAKKFLNATFFVTCSQLNFANSQEFKVFINFCLINSFFVLGKKINESDKDYITKIRDMFVSEILEDHSNYTVKEIHRIFNLGVRGKLGYYEKLDLNLMNFSLWIQNYEKNKNVHAVKIINYINSMPIDDAIQTEEIKYEYQINQINDLLKIKNKVSKEDFVLKINNLLLILPKVIYDCLVFKKKIKKDDYKNFISEGFKNESSPIESINNINIDNYINQKAYRISITNFLLKYGKANI